MARRQGNADVAHVWDIGNQEAMTLSSRGLLLRNKQYIHLEEFFYQRPVLKVDNELAGAGADSAATLLKFATANKNFSVIGTNMTSALATFSASGGVTLTTAGANNDQAILLPSLTTGLTAWSGTSWLTQKGLRYEQWIRTGASIAATTIWAGLKLTNTPVAATDANQFYLRYNDTEKSGQWQLITSRGGVLTTTVIPITVAVSTLYRIVLELDPTTLTLTLWINGVKYDIGTGALGLTTAIALIPYTGVQAGAVAAKAIDVLYTSMQRAA